jgi:hypothetical protein
MDCDGFYWNGDRGESVAFALSALIEFRSARNIAVKIKNNVN